MCVCPVRILSYRWSVVHARAFPASLRATAGAAGYSAVHPTATLDRRRRGTCSRASRHSLPWRLGRRRSHGATSTCSSSPTSTHGSLDTPTLTTRRPLMPTTVLCSPSTSVLPRALPRPAATCSSCRMATSTTAPGFHGCRQRLSCPSSRRCPSTRSPRATMSCTRTKPSSTSHALMASLTAGMAPSSHRTSLTRRRASHSVRAPSLSLSLPLPKTPIPIPIPIPIPQPQPRPQRQP